MAKKVEKNAIDARIEELKEIYKDLPTEKMALAMPLIENAAFIENEMRKLQEVIKNDGAVDEYQNGANQFGKKQSANLQSYNALVKSYNMINTRLEAMLPARKKEQTKLGDLMNE